MTTILFVCTGNTCRSPMAACLFNDLCRRNGKKDIQALSAGTNTMNGLPASGGAIRAMAARGLSLKDHRSAMLDRELLSRVDLVMAVSPRHVELIQRTYPNINAQLIHFEPEIIDPYQGSDALYESTAAQMEPQIAALFHLLTTNV